MGDELVALDPQRGTCFGFNAVAASVWRSLLEPKTFAQLQRELLDEYTVSEAECRIELQQLLSDLLAKGLIQEGASESATKSNC